MAYSSSTSSFQDHPPQKKFKYDVTAIGEYRGIVTANLIDLNIIKKKLSYYVFFLRLFSIPTAYVSPFFFLFFSFRCILIFLLLLFPFFRFYCRSKIIFNLYFYISFLLRSEFKFINKYKIYSLSSSVLFYYPLLSNVF